MKLILTFPLVDIYTGEILADIGEQYDIPDNSTIRMGGKLDYLCLHTTQLSQCFCKNCAPNFNVILWESA